jgi:2-polyprenyl-6-methoxyphenol hydroxylase-like FAD-dependent oxidoreductase
MRALICGAGVAGLTLARLLDEMGWDVTLLERASELRYEGYQIDFFGPGFDAAESMGLLPQLRQTAYEVTDANYVDRSGRPRAALNYQRMVKSLDGRLLSLLRGDLARSTTASANTSWSASSCSVAGAADDSAAGPGPLPKLTADRWRRQHSLKRCFSR